MTKAQVIESIQKDIERAKANRDRFEGSYEAGAFTNYMHYDGQVHGLELALMTLKYLDEK